MMALRRSLVATTELTFGTDCAMARLIQIDLFALLPISRNALKKLLGSFDR
jgi:hypothetical protein